MKTIQTWLALTVILVSCSYQNNKSMGEFKAEKISKTASINVQENIVTVFPLFGAFEESKWEKGWNPKLIYPAKKIIEEGTTFSSKGHDEESEYLWRVSKYEPDNYHIQYLVSTPNRYWTITVKCEAQSESITGAEVTYTFFGLNEMGNELNKLALDKMYNKNLKDWEEALNYYLINGKAI